MPIRSLIQPGAFEPELIAILGEVFDAACEERPDVPREVIANRIIAAARLGERDPVHLRQAAFSKPA